VFNSSDDNNLEQLQNQNVKKTDSFDIGAVLKLLQKKGGWYSNLCYFENDYSDTVEAKHIVLFTEKDYETMTASCFGNELESINSKHIDLDSGKVTW